MLAAGYASLGLLVGILCGLTDSPIATALLAALFAFAGGTATYVVERNKLDRTSVGSILTSFCLLCIVGLLGGIFVKENRLLTLPWRPNPTPSPNPYLHHLSLNELNEINQRKISKADSCDEAYAKLWDLVQRSLQDNP